MPPSRSAGVHPTVWNRNAGINPEAAKVQQIAAQQVKQTRCKSDVKQRQGTDGTAPMDYKCKKKKDA